MSMKIGEKPFFDRVDDALDDDFMRRAMGSAQDRLRDKELDATERDEQIGDWEEWRNAGEEYRSHRLENLDCYSEQLSIIDDEDGWHGTYVQTTDKHHQ